MVQQIINADTVCGRCGKNGMLTDNVTGELTNPVTVETTMDGQTFAWGPGEKRVFADSGVAAGHDAFSASVIEDDTATTINSPAETVTSRS